MIRLEPGNVDLTKLLDKAERRPVTISPDGKRKYVVMSCKQYDWLRAALQRVARTEDAPAVIFEAVKSSEMDKTHSYLDDLMK